MLESTEFQPILPREDQLKSRIRLGVSLAVAHLVFYLFPLWPISAAPVGLSSEAVEFSRDIRPIFSDNCFTCHGPDVKMRQANLRLDAPIGPFEDRGGRHIIVPRDSSQSGLFQRISSENEAVRMPPSWSGRTLTTEQIELVRRWINQGAQWQIHWSFIPPQRPPLPKVNTRFWPRNPIDYFILARLEDEGLLPSPEADRETLIRRVTLDLTGLPPTPAELAAFLRDESTHAYEKVIDRLLQSSHYGERMAMEWLDAARYADTHGYQTDGNRDMWRWRDWVIQAFNRNMPFDQFTIEQIAGDLLPDATVEQRIATGFNRNHRSNSEGGIVPKEYLVEYAVDRVNTTATVWLGLTLGCARCHDHKYDPISQNEFYQVLAYFNNVPERGRVYKIGNSEPFIKAPTPQMQWELDDLDRKLTSAKVTFRNIEPESVAAQMRWETNQAMAPLVDWTISDGLVTRFELNGQTTDQNTDWSGSWISIQDNENTHKFEPDDLMCGPGKTGQAADFDGHRFIDAGKVAQFGPKDKISFGAWIYPTETQSGGILSVMDKEFRPENFSLHLSDNKIRVSLGQRWLDDAIHVETKMNLTPMRWYHVMITHNGSQRSKGLKIYVNGELQKVKVLMDLFTGDLPEIQKYPLRIGVGDEEKYFRGYIDDVRYYHRELLVDEIEVVSSSDSITEILAISPEERTPQQARKISTYFLENEAPPHIRDAYLRFKTLRKQRRQLEDSIPTVMVMEEAEEPRQTFLLKRGEYDKPGEKVSRGVPAIFPPFPQGMPNNRLGLGRWLVDPSNPLTSRVTVNRYWQMFFGTGLVKTPEDFGSQGELPSHPQLMDWLATELVGGGWNIKALQKLIVMSATYLQSSRISESLQQYDPDNRLLARAPRLRLPAEMIRDQALAACGLLTVTIGGPSVKPYQPPGLWKELFSGSYVQDHGDKLYRRSVYTFWKRTIPPPTMTTFDADARETCTVRRSHTNTPLQALALMNDVTYVEAARLLAQRMMTEGGNSPEERLSSGFRLLTARWPSPQEQKILLNTFYRNRLRYYNDEEAALNLISVGESEWSQELDIRELATYTTVASLILNLDEVITRQ